ncbi:uncharacterized protein LOC127100384 [Lathyrus oleraceus]|uniref:uncharacterized protein LOC127100384 n=1 Tax=Pisum sativum TaxID=3888 RepID=UPI0021D03DB9|nr:uncharacterized protein LOC127100384 [Pisum sativum]
MIGDRIEKGLRDGKIQGAIVTPNAPNKYSGGFQKKKEGDTNAISRGYKGKQQISYDQVAAVNRVQDLIEAKVVTFTPRRPNVNTNPMPTHGGASVSSIEEINKGELIKKVEEIQTPIAVIGAQLLKSGLIPIDLVNEENIEELKSLIQRLLDQGELQIERRNKYMKEKEIVAISIPYDTINVEIPITQLVIEFPAPFAYEDEKAVPWIYQPRAFKQGQEDQPVVINEPNVTSIMGPAGIRHSGLVFAPRTVDASSKDKGKEVATHVQIPIPNLELQEMRLSPKAAITQEEAEEFLKIIKKSDYKVVDQLNQTPSKTSMLSLLLSSEAHKDSLIKVLSVAHIMKDIIVEQFDDVIACVTTRNFLGFNDDELPAEGKNHNKALHISLRCIYTLLSRVLVDTGSPLNVIPKTTLVKIPLEGLNMKPNTLIVRAFDGSRQAVIGEVDLPIKIGPTIFSITFQVMDIHPRYIELEGEITETPFQSLEVVNQGTKAAIENGRAQGWGKVIEVLEKWDTFGLGYEPSLVEASSQHDKKQVPPIEETFTSVGHIFSGHVVMINDEAYDEVVSSWIHQAAPDEELKNWKTVEIPQFFKK